MSLVAINWNPEPRQLRQFALGGAAVLGTLAAWVAYRQGASIGAVSLAVLGTALAVCGVVWPRGVRGVYLGMTVVTFPIGWVMSHILLGLIYYGVFTFVALIFRVIGRDALQRRLEPEAPTYWQPKAEVRDPRRYLRQF